MARHTPQTTCPECGAVIGPYSIKAHADWHRHLSAALSWVADRTGGPPTDAEADAHLAQTAEFPPIGETIRRRPPVPDVRELKGAELLRALADEMDRDGLSGEDL